MATRDRFAVYDFIALSFHLAIVPVRMVSLSLLHFIPSTRYRDRFAAVNSKKLPEQIATAGQQKHTNSMRMENYNAYLAFRKIVFTHVAHFPLIIYVYITFLQRAITMYRISN